MKVLFKRQLYEINSTREVQCAWIELKLIFATIYDLQTFLQVITTLKVLRKKYWIKQITQGKGLNVHYVFLGHHHYLIISEKDVTYKTSSNQ